MAGILENVGIIDGFGKLTDGSQKAIIERLNEAQLNGTDSTPPVPKQHQLPADILDKEKYPAFHKEVLGAYEGAMTSLNLQGNFSLPPPFIDPLALANKLNPGLDINFDYATLPTLNPVSLALIIEITPLDLMSKLALPPNDPDAIIKPPLPNFSLPSYMPSPAYLKELENISRPFPSPGFPMPFLDKIEFDLWKSPQLGIPLAFAEVLKQLLQNPAKILGLIAPKPDLNFAIEAVQKSGIFGKYDQGEITKAAMQQDLIKYVAQATGVVALGMTIGDGGPKGATSLTARGSKLTIVEENLEIFTYDKVNAVNRRMVNIASAFLGKSDKVGEEATRTTGHLSIKDPGRLYPNFILQKGYKDGEIPTATTFGIATTCGLLTPTCIDVLLGKGWDASGGVKTYSGGDATEQQPPSPIKEAIEQGLKNTPNVKSRQGGKGTSIPKGPIGCMLFGKYLRAWVPSGGGRLPEPGDIYFVTNGNPESGAGGEVLHTGMIAGGNRLSSKINGNIVITADAGQGPAGTAKGSLLQIGANILTRQDATQAQLAAAAAANADIAALALETGSSGGGAPGQQTSGTNEVQPQRNVKVETVDKKNRERVSANSEAGYKAAQGSPANQQTCWARKLWNPGDSRTGSAHMTGDFGPGPNKVEDDAYDNPSINNPATTRMISGWISIARLCEVIGKSVPNGDADKATQLKCKAWVEYAYDNVWNQTFNQGILWSYNVFDDDAYTPTFYSIDVPGAKKPPWWD